jgi:hypothetical protein
MSDVPRPDSGVGETMIFVWHGIIVVRKFDE